MKKTIALIFSFMFVLLFSNCSEDAIGNPTAGGRVALLDSSVLYTADSLAVRVNDTGVVNVANLLQWTNTNSAVTQISVSFTGAIDNNTGYSNKYLGITTEANNTVNFVYRKYNQAITGPHYFTATLPTSNFKLEIYLKHYVNSKPNAFIKLSNIVVRRLF